jgi:hypothetical protein
LTVAGASSASQELAALEKRCRTPVDSSDCLDALAELLDLYDQAPDLESESAERMRRAFLHGLGHVPSELIEHKDAQRFAIFLTEQVKTADLAGIRWQSPEEVIIYYEVLHSLQFEDERQVEQIRRHARTLLAQALTHFERQGDLEKLFTLFQLAPTSPLLEDSELRRLRNRAYLYEVRRVQRHRRLLYGYLVVQALLILIVFPLLFINAENGVLRDQLEQATGVDLPNEGRRFFSYGDGLYWALITAASIGYGDLTPQTTLGRTLAAILGVMGVISIGVVAGLILDWISPRPLE